METEPQKAVREIWAYLTPEEAYQLLDSLVVWAEEVEDGRLDPGWHTHITEDDRELTLAISPQYGEPSFASRFARPP